MPPEPDDPGESDPSGAEDPRPADSERSDAAQYAELSDEALLAECRVETFMAGGPGGQHQNRTESGVRLTHLPTGISAIARESRSQHRNRKRALARLRAALEERARPEKPRRPTRVPVSAKRKRLDEKRRRSELKRTRRKPERDD